MNLFEDLANGTRDMGFFKRIFYKREMPGIRLLVFDFDGTIADTRGLLLKIVSRHLAKFNISLTKNLIIKFGNAPLVDYLSLAGLRRDLIQSISTAIVADFIAEHHAIKPCKNLMAIRNIEIPKVIVSHNITSFIEKTLNFLHANFFERIYGADRFVNKIQAIRSLCRKYHVAPSEVIYIGDKNVDVRVARGVGCYSVIISGKSAWSPRAAVAKEHPDYILTDLGKLPGVLAQINAEQFPAV